MKSFPIGQKVLYAMISVVLLCGHLAMGQVSGKIAGRIVDSETGDPLIGTNIMLIDTYLGAATDYNGDFFILNVAPGVYTLKARMMGYKDYNISNLRVSVNRTAFVEISMEKTILQGEAVIVEAQKIATKKDQTSTVKNVSADKIEILPVENLSGIVSMQAGVVNGHFRGGRQTEVSYLIDGMQVDEAFEGQGRSAEIQPEAIADLEVITGTFNAEYGKAMSGIVNAVTKDGTDNYHGSFTGYLGNYFTNHNNIFPGLDKSEITRNQDYRIVLSGPILKERIHFFANYRSQNNKNYLNGIRRFQVTDYSDFTEDDPDMWYSEHNGDSSYVPMDRSVNQAFMGKLSMQMFKNLKVSLLYNWNNDTWHSYNHSFKYNPDGMAFSRGVSNLWAVTFNHMLNQKLFYELKFSQLSNYTGWYLYENPLDSRYVHDAYFSSSGPGFYTGGQQKGHTRRTIDDTNLKFDLTWQFNKRNSLKTGLLWTEHRLDNEEAEIRNVYSGLPEESEYEEIFVNGNWKRNYLYYEPTIMADSTVYSDIYLVKPVEFSAYLQDKVEFDVMVLNLGVRYDRFNPETVYPSQLRNPANQSDFSSVPGGEEKMSTYPKAGSQTQVSPRFGLSYLLGKTAVLHFSYGHFFQMPQMSAIYRNHSFQIAPADYATVLGNSRIKAQRTVSYEIGLWQEIMTDMDVDVALFYRDIYDLLSTKVISTYNQIEYGLYTNKDYGNARGLELKYEFTRGNLGLYLNYTLQYTRGNADNPLQTFTRSGDSMDPINYLIPMSWDQRHTLNLTAAYNTAKYGTTLIAYYNSGTPYSWEPVVQSILARVNLFPNNTWQPSRFSIDLNAYYNISLAKDMSLKLLCTVYNLFDALNEEWVNSQTGRAYSAIILDVERAGHRSDFNQIEDIYQNPSMYSAPRLVKLGLALTF